MNFRLILSIIFLKCILCFYLDDQKKPLNNSTNINYMIQNIGIGHNCSTEEYPFMVLILKRILQTSFEKVCGGTLIRNRWVLTSASCVNEEYSHYAILASTSSHNEEPLLVYVREVILHPNYREERYTNNIALLKLEERLELETYNIEYVELPEAEVGKSIDHDLPCQEGLVMGWGKSIADEYPDINQLICAKVPLVSLLYCQKLYKAVYSLTVEQDLLCTRSTKGATPCSKDDGGPLLCGKVQVGIYSWGFGCRKVSNPSMYVPVNQYLGFIHSIAGNGAALKRNVFNLFIALSLLYLCNYY